MGHVRKGRQARLRRQESAVARQAQERARYAMPPYVPGAIGITDRIEIAPLTHWEIRRMLAASLPQRDHLWWLRVTDV